MEDIFCQPDRTRLFPLFWMKGEDEAALRRGVGDVYNSGCRALVAESRTHPDYLGPAWWRDLGIVLDEAKKRDMKVWVLDDQHFPSGYAAGAAEGTPFARMMLFERHMDVIGPIQGGAFVVQDDETELKPGEGVVAVIAAQRLNETTRVESLVDLGGYKLGQRVDLTGSIVDGMAYWDVPEGIWRVFVLSCSFVMERRPPRTFLNPLLPDSSRITIEKIYQPHFDQFASEFGKTFMGFFSDEPALRAGLGYHAIVGEYPGLPIPWRPGMEGMLSRALGKDARSELPGLWYDIGSEDTPRIRFALMDTASRLYGENYSMPIGEWCRAHNVSYIGHVIEQNNTHCRLGSGAGHFFRAISGQDMAGIDIVLHELRPEFRGGTHAWESQEFEADDDFFRFMLIQMAVSFAYLDPVKKGRTMCEIFGAYGWQEDVREMRYLANFVLSRGCNHFSPHAFTLAKYPDPDSPPHFDPLEHTLMPFISDLFTAMAHGCELLTGGQPLARAAVLYYAEGEWACGSQGCMKTQDIVKALNQRQIECKIVPIDMLGKAEFDVLLIPYAKRWPLKLLQELQRLRRAGRVIRFVGGLPQGLSQGEGCMRELLEGLESLPLDEAPALCESYAPLPYRSMCVENRVHLYPYQRDQELILAVFNEDVREDVCYSVWVQDERSAYVLNNETRVCQKAAAYREGKGQTLTLKIEPGQLLFVLLTDRMLHVDPVLPALYKAEEHQPEWKVSLQPAGSDAFTFWREALAPFNVTAPEHFPRFSGTVSCEALLRFPEDTAAFELDTAGSVRAWLDGMALPARVAPPYRFTFAPCCGEHRIRLEITNAPVFRTRDPLSFYACILPTGIMGGVRLYTCATDKLDS